MLPWNRPEAAAAGALLLAASFLPASAAQDGSAAVDAPGRATVTPLGQLEQESAQQRWDRIKSRYQPLVTDTSHGASETATGPAASPAKGSTLPIPDHDDAFGWESARKNSAAPLPNCSEEPAWVVSAAPVDSPPVTAPVAAQTAPTTPTAADVMENETAPVDLSEFADIATVAAQADPALPPMPSAGSEGTTAPSRRPVRRINEILPFYNTKVDEDIREYADARAGDYDVKFGDEQFQPRMFPDTAMAWEASNYYHYPLYFEDVVLERYGHTYPFVVQPFVSAAKFSGQLLALPYQMTLDPINKPMYALGYYRPGEVAPKLKYQIPWNAQAAAVQAGVTTGLIFLIP